MKLPREKNGFDLIAELLLEALRRVDDGEANVETQTKEPHKKRPGNGARERRA